MSKKEQLIVELWCQLRKIPYLDMAIEDAEIFSQLSMHSCVKKILNSAKRKVSR